MTGTRIGGVGVTWRFAPAVLFLCLFAVPVSAQIPQTTIDQIVALSVQRAENSFVWNSDQIDRATWTARQKAIDEELNPLLQEVKTLSGEQQRQVNSQIKGLTEARLALARPMWQTKADAFRLEREERQRALMTGVMSDAQKALEPQRRRVLLQARRDRGEITPDEFSSEDKKALDEIMALRNKYAAEGQGYDRRFDSELARLTREMAKPQPPPPDAVASTPQVSRRAPQAKAPENPTSDAVYAREVYVAGDLYWGMLEAQRRFQEGDVDDVTVNTVKTALQPDLEKLINKWRAAGRAAEFEKDYKQAADNRMAAEKEQRQSERRAAIVGWITAALSFAAIIGGVYVAFLILRAMGRKPTPGRPVTSTVFGTAHFAPVEITAEADCLARGVFFGKSSAPDGVPPGMDVAGAPICSTPENHTLIVARTRTGKGTRVIVPTLLRYAGSAFVIDPKGENAAITGRVRRDQLQQDVHVLNPWNELASTYLGLGFVRATYNPLDILDRNDPNAVAIAQSLAQAICPPPVGEETFWRGSAGGLLTAVFLWLAHRDKIGEKKTLGRAREIVTVTRAKFRTDYLVQMAACEAFDGAIRELAAYFIDMADETYSGIIANLAESTRFLSDPQIKAATASSSFSMDDLIKKGTTVYLVIPTDRMDTQKTWLRLVVAAAMHTYKRTEIPVESRRRCLFMIDEFAALGRVADLPRDIASMGGCGIDFALVVQGLDQLKEHYGDARATIMSNCAYQWFCNLNDLDSAEYLSKTLGKKTVTTGSSSYSSSAGPGGGSSTQSTSQSETGRALFNPDELMNLGKNAAILLQPNGHPHYLKPVDYWNLPKAFAYLEQDLPSLYWEPPLVYDKNPYVAAPPPPGSGGQAGSGASPRRQKMTVDDAREALGVKVGATSDEVRKAYLNLMTKVHPDHGGSSFLAKQLNEAKEILLGL